MEFQIAFILLLFVGLALNTWVATFSAFAVFLAVHVGHKGKLLTALVVVFSASAFGAGAFFYLYVLSGMEYLSG